VAPGSDLVFPLLLTRREAIFLSANPVSEAVRHLKRDRSGTAAMRKTLRQQRALGGTTPASGAAELFQRLHERSLTRSGHSVRARAARPASEPHPRRGRADLWFSAAEGGERSDGGERVDEPSYGAGFIAGRSRVNNEATVWAFAADSIDE
jgi:hypothetical protein